MSNGYNAKNYFAHGGNHEGRAKRVLECRGQRKALRRHGTPGAIGAHGAKSVIGGKLTFLPGAEVEGADALPAAFQGEEKAQIPNQPQSQATTVAALREDFNELLNRLKESGVMASDSAE